MNIGIAVGIVGSLVGLAAIMVSVVQHRRGGWILEADCAGFNHYMSGGVLVDRPAIEIVMRNKGRTPVSVNAFVLRFSTTESSPIDITVRPDWMLAPFRLADQQIASGQTRSWVLDVESLAHALVAHPKFEKLGSEGDFALMIALGSGHLITPDLGATPDLPRLIRRKGGEILFVAPEVGGLD